MSKLFHFHSMTVLIIITSLILITAGFSHADKKVVATVNGVAIKQSELTAEVNRKLPLASYHARISNEKLQQYQHQALQNLIEEELLYQEAKRQKLEIKQIELQHRVAMMKNGYASENDFQQALAKAGLNILTLMERVERRLLIEKIQQKEIIAKVQVTDSDLHEYFENNKTKFIRPPRFRVRHILISVAPGAMTAGWRAGLEKAQQIYARIITGEDFASLATGFSADSTSRAAGCSRPSR
ncbi:MAG: SurA N-terminal domain-containing protein, partial [bacterium]